MGIITCCIRIVKIFMGTVKQVQLVQLDPEGSKEILDLLDPQEELVSLELQAQEGFREILVQEEMMDSQVQWDSQGCQGQQVNNRNVSMFR